MADTDYIPPTGMAVRWMAWKHHELVGGCVCRRILAANLPKPPQKPILAAMLTCFEAGLYSDQGGSLLHIDKGLIKYTEDLWADNMDILQDKAEKAGLDASGNSVNIITRLAAHYASQQRGSYREPTPSMQSSKSPASPVLYSCLLTIARRLLPKLLQPPASEEHRRLPTTGHRALRLPTTGHRALRLPITGHQALQSSIYRGQSGYTHRTTA
jgi:hypothetical protein